MSTAIRSGSSALLVVDFQQKLFPAMPDGYRDAALKHVDNLLFAARRLDIPIVASEQYPKGLGASLESLGLEAALPKTTFSAMETPAIRDALDATGRTQVVVVGMETHICVAQTVRDLRTLGYNVFVVGDACLSRRKLDWSLAMRRMGTMGAVPVTAEAVLFEWLGDSRDPLFREVSRRIR